MAETKLRVATIFGTRPEAIKVAPVIAELSKHSTKVASTLIVTAQHRDMLDQVLNLFDIAPEVDLDIMEEEQTLPKITTNALEKLEAVLLRLAPDLVIIQGDTTTAFVTALAAYYQRIRVGHIEGGLRSEDKYQPFPEEINRRMISSLADLHFAPTRLACQNLLDECVAREAVFLTGNTVVDALLHITRQGYRFSRPPLRDLDFERDKIVVVTAHRRENWGAPLENICRALKRLVEERERVRIVFPVHLNPIVQRVVRGALAGHPRIHLLDPLDYQSFAHLMKRCYLILTDSGGIQEEAPTFGKPVLVLRETTERPEGIQTGVAKLVGTSTAQIVETAEKLIDSQADYDSMAKKTNPYGDGQAARRIVKVIMEQSPRPRAETQHA